MSKCYDDDYSDDPMGNTIYDSEDCYGQPYPPTPVTEETHQNYLDAMRACQRYVWRALKQEENEQPNRDFHSSLE